MQGACQKLGFLVKLLIFIGLFFCLFVFSVLFLWNVDKNGHFFVSFIGWCWVFVIENGTEPTHHSIHNSAFNSISCLCSKYI